MNELFVVYFDGSKCEKTQSVETQELFMTSAGGASICGRISVSVTLATALAFKIDRCC